MPTTNFAAAAATFDEQRGFPEKIGQDLCEIVLSRLPARPQLLEVGIGTGRIAAAFVHHEVRYVGLDDSSEMLRRCRTRLASTGAADLVRGDARRLPFPGGAFDGVIAASLFRVVTPWQTAAAEMERVLVPGGSLFLVHHEAAPDSMEDVLGREKREILTQLGVEAYPAGGAGDTRVARAFAERGAAVEQIVTADWMRPSTPRACIDRYLLAGRVAGQPWASELARQLEQFAVARYGSLTAAEQVRHRLQVHAIKLRGEHEDMGRS